MLLLKVVLCLCRCSSSCKLEKLLTLALMQVLNLASNALTGTLPYKWSAMTALKVCVLDV